MKKNISIRIINTYIYINNYIYMYKYHIKRFNGQTRQTFCNIGRAKVFSAVVPQAADAGKIQSQAAKTTRASSKKMRKSHDHSLYNCCYIW